MMKKIILPAAMVLFATLGLAQSNQIIDHTTMTSKTIKAVFESAYIDVLSEADAGLLVKDTYSIYILLNDSKNRYIEFAILNDFKEGVADMDKYKFVNKVNSELIEITAYYDTEKNQAVFKYDLWVEGNVTQDDVIKAFKGFQNSLTASVLRDTSHILK